MDPTGGRPRRDDTATLHAPRPPAPEESRVSFVVTVTGGADRGRSLVVDQTTPSRILIGQGPACELRLGDPHVSRRHVSFELAEPHLRIVDLDSKNGTFVNGLRVTDAFLVGGEMVRVGDTTLAVQAVTPREGLPPPSDAMRFGRVVGASPEMRRLYPLCERLAASEVPVVLEGETGTGKEQLAEALHELGPRSAGPFVVFDCTAVPDNLLESALFGHERGAFTGAVGTRKGVFEQAHGGTILIDEIGDLDLALQPKLLRVLERGELQRVGGDRWLRVEVRVLAATRRDLDKEVQEGRFRDDLFFRLAVTRIELPPLRRRRGDIALLARHFWRKLGGREAPFPDGLLARLEAYDWPGNVRELQNAIARQLALGDSAPITALRAEAEVDTAPVSPSQPAEASEPSEADWMDQLIARELPFPRARDEVVAEFGRRYIANVLARHGGNVARAAAASGIARRYFQVIRSRSK